MSRTSRTSDVTSREHDDDDDDDDQEVSFYPSVHERPQVWARGALAPPPPSGNVVKCFCAL